MYSENVPQCYKALTDFMHSYKDRSSVLLLAVAALWACLASQPLTETACFYNRGL